MRLVVELQYGWRHCAYKLPWLPRVSFATCLVQGLVFCSVFYWSRYGYAQFWLGDVIFCYKLKCWITILCFFVHLHNHWWSHPYASHSQSQSASPLMDTAIRWESSSLIGGLQWNVKRTGECVRTVTLLLRVYETVSFVGFNFHHRWDQINKQRFRFVEQDLPC